MLPDTGERYLTTPLFEDVAEEMTAEEIALSKSTPNVRFDVSPPPPPPAKEEETPVEISPEAQAFFESSIASKDDPVVMFALEWCEFCWSVRKMFAEYDIPYRSVDLDSVAYQDNDWGGQIRAVLAERVGAPTIPQIFIGDRHIGGYDDLAALDRAGELDPLLEPILKALRA